MPQVTSDMAGAAPFLPMTFVRIALLGRPVGVLVKVAGEGLMVDVLHQGPDAAPRLAGLGG